MSQIIRLDDHLINQIAAGEVIENPSSVVKELLDNSIDSGARRISVEISQGGKELIYIEDDGMGMSKEDLIMCVERHATSKITSKDDLFSMETLGFRGEALASIAAISHLEIISSKNEIAHKISVKGGTKEDVVLSKRGRGTTVKVTHLFYNVPVRKKFQKSVSSCTREVIRVLQTLALCHPGINFSLKSEDKSFHFFSTESKKNRIKEVLGNDFLEESHFIDFEEGPIKIEGVVSSPTKYKTHRKGQHLFINNRPVLSPLISVAIREGYSTLLPEKAYPLFVLYLSLPNQGVDVNVHPQKKEVRLLDEKTLFMKIEKAVSDAMSNIDTPCVDFSPSFTSRTPVFDIVPKFFKEIKRENIKDFDSLSPSDPQMFTNETQSTFKFKKESAYSFLWKRGSLVLVEEDCLVLVDLRAVFARSLFEQMIKKEEKMVVKQKLFLPTILQVSQEEMMMIEDNELLLRGLGFEIRKIAEDTLSVDSLPSYLSLEKAEEFIYGLIHDLDQNKKIKEKNEKYFASLSSKIARRRTSFSDEETKKLLQLLSEEKTYIFCPLGKKMKVLLTKENLEKMFVL